MNSTPTKPLTDSPWFWLLLFGSMALALLAAVEPKFTRRYERLERMHQARSQVAARSAAQRAAASSGEQVAEAGDAPFDAVAVNIAAFNRADGGGGRLRPLMFFLAGLMFLAVIAMVVARRRTEAAR